MLALLLLTCAGAPDSAHDKAPDTAPEYAAVVGIARVVVPVFGVVGSRVGCGLAVSRLGEFFFVDWAAVCVCFYGLWSWCALCVCVCVRTVCGRGARCVCVYLRSVVVVRAVFFFYGLWSWCALCGWLQRR